MSRRSISNPSGLQPIVEGGYFYNFEAEIIRRKREQEEEDKIADRRIDELGKKWKKHMP